MSLNVRLLIVSVLMVSNLVCLVSLTYLTPIGCLFFIVQYHPAFTGQHHEVVYKLLLQGVCEGPTFIFYTALKRTSHLFIRGTRGQAKKKGKTLPVKCKWLLKYMALGRTIEEAYKTF